MRRLLATFNDRDWFVFAGFVAVLVGVSGRFGWDVGLIVVGMIILIKGLTRWV